MKTKTILIMLAVVTATLMALTNEARAWDGPTLWYESAVGGPNGPKGPGGGGIIGTGGAMDHNITCAHCHIKGVPNYGTLATTVTFQPPITTNYKLGQKYTVTVAITNERLGKSGCEPMMDNVNGFAASFEDDGGKVAGTLKAEFGDANACAASTPQGFNGTTYTYGDCHAVMGTTKNGAPTWTFEWTAPPTAAGNNVTMYYAAVDGDCMMNSMNDDVKVGTVKLGAGIAKLDDPAPGSGSGAGAKSNNARALAFVGLLPMFAIASSAMKRRRAKLRGES